MRNKLAWFGIGYAIYLGVINTLRLEELEKELDRLRPRVH